MTIRNLTYYIIALLGTALMTTACSEIDHFEEGVFTGPGEEYNLRLFLDAGALPEASRAPEEGYQPGVGYENYLDVPGGDYRVAVFSADNEWLFDVDQNDLTIAPINVGDYTSKRYILDFEVTATAAETINEAGKVKIVILANWHGNYPSLSAGSRLEGLFARAQEIAYNDLAVGNLTSADDRIPMYGVHEFTGVTLRPGLGANHLGTVHLLRALAKVEVIDDKYTSLRISGVKLNRHVTSAAPMPKGVTHQDHYVKGTYAGDYVKYPSFPAAWGDDMHITDEPVELKKDVNGSWVVYLPEFDNTGENVSDDDHIRLEVSFENLENTDFIDFKYYDNAPEDSEVGDYFDVLRNNIYRFTVKKNAHGMIYPVVDIIPYSSVYLEPDFGLERDPINGWMVFRNDKGYLLCYYDEETRTFYDNDYQKITFTTKADALSWIEVVDAKGVFAWYFDVETGKMYDIEGRELIGLKRHETTGWVVYDLPEGGGIDYYLNPLSIAVYDRNRAEVELETPEATGAYKYLRDGNSHIIVRFDAIRNKVFDAAGNEVTLDRDADDRMVLTCPQDDNIIFCRYDRATGKFYSAEGFLMNKNPFSNPGWEPYRYTNGSLICFYDQLTGKFYDSDLDEITFEPHESQPWLKVVDHDGNFMWYFNYENGRIYNEGGLEMGHLERDRTTGNLIRRDHNGDIAYYINPISLLVYDVTQTVIRFTHADHTTQALKELTYDAEKVGGPATYYFDAASGKFYYKDMSEVDMSSLAYDSKGRVVIHNDNGDVFRYYDVSEGNFYTQEGIIVTNPFIEHTFDDVITDDNKFVCFYYQDEDRFTDGYRRTLTWERKMGSNGNLWFKVVDSDNKFFWYVDVQTMKLYDVNDNEITRPSFYNGSKKITSGEIDWRTGRIEYLNTGDAANYYANAYWLDPLSLVMYDRYMCEIILPRKSDATGSKQIFRVGENMFYTIDVLNRQIYKKEDPVNMYGFEAYGNYYFWFRCVDDGCIHYGYNVDDGTIYKTAISASPSLGEQCSNPSNPFLDQL